MATFTVQRYKKTETKTNKKCRALNTTNLAKAPHAYSRQHGVDEEKKCSVGDNVLQQGV
jgi:hypothetical protein